MKDSLGNLPFGFSVTQVANHFPQPHGGLLPPSMFEKTFWADTEDLAPKENIHPSIVGTTVDYLSRMMTGTPKEEAFAIALRGADIAGKKERASSLRRGRRRGSLATTPSSAWDFPSGCPAAPTAALIRTKQPSGTS